MGGRGSGSGLGASIGGGGGDNVTIISATDLVSERERNQSEVDEVLSVLRDVMEDYGYVVDETIVAKLSPKDGSTMAFYANDQVAINNKYFNAKKMESAYDDCIKQGYHPPKGNKTGMEATTAHELGHALTDMASKKAGFADLDAMARQIVGEAFKAKTSAQAKKMAGKISGYAEKSDAECVAEAYSDVYCNGENARTESKKIVDVLNKYAK